MQIPKVNLDRLFDPVLPIVFFFQAEDGILYIGVTGVQTCALPIWSSLPRRLPPRRTADSGSSWGSSGRSLSRRRRRRTRWAAGTTASIWAGWSLRSRRVRPPIGREEGWGRGADSGGALSL